MGLSESRFNMWRAVTAMIHADGVVRPHEINFILENTRQLPLSTEQFETLTEDLRTAGDVVEMFGRITQPQDKRDFFHLARAIAWSDGEFDEREQELLTRIRALAVLPQDVDLAKEAVDHFRDLYIEGGGERGGDPSLFTMIRGLIGRKSVAAA